MNLKVKINIFVMLSFFVVYDVMAEMPPYAATFVYSNGSWSWNGGTIVTRTDTGYISAPACENRSGVVAISNRNELSSIGSVLANHGSKPDGDFFVLCGSGVTDDGAGTKYLNNYPFLIMSGDRVIKTGKDRVMVAYDTSGRTPLFMYNPNTRDYSLMPSDVEVRAVLDVGNSPDNSSSLNMKSVNLADLNDAKAKCGRIKDLGGAKNMATANTVVSALGAASAIGGAVTGGLAGNQKFLGQQKDSLKTQKGLGTAAAVTGGLSALTSVASATMSGMSIKQIEDVMRDVEDCKKAINKL